MPAQKKTTLGLNQWIGSEYPKRIDFVEDNKIIDDELLKRVEYTDTATEEKKGIAQIHSLDTVENQSNELQNIIANNLQSQVSDFIKKLNHDEILTVKSLVKYLSKLLKPATENKFGLIDFQTIKQVSPKPDLSPYMRWDKGYRNGNSSDYVIRANLTDVWAPRNLHMYLENGDYMGVFHLNGVRAYYKAPNHAGGAWCEIMDNHDMAIRDNNITHAHNRVTETWNKATEAWSKANDAQMNRVASMRLAGYTYGSPGSIEAIERQSYVVTGLIGNAPSGGFGQVQYVQMRALQYQLGNGTWVNTPSV